MSSSRGSTTSRVKTGRRHAIHTGTQAALLHAEGRFGEAVDAGSYAAGISDVPQAVKQGLVWAVESALALGERGRADELLAAVEALPPGLRAPFLEAQTQRFRARMSNDEAGFKSAAAGFREYDIPFWLAVTLLEHGELTGDASLLDEAREIFERLGAAPWLERARRRAGEARRGSGLERATQQRPRARRARRGGTAPSPTPRSRRRPRAFRSRSPRRPRRRLRARGRRSSPPA